MGWEMVRPHGTASEPFCGAKVSGQFLQVAPVRFSGVTHWRAEVFLEVDYYERWSEGIAVGHGVFAVVVLFLRDEVHDTVV